jgi:hypothetical protein
MNGDKQLENVAKERHGRCRDDRSAYYSGNHGNDITVVSPGCVKSAGRFDRRQCLRREYQCREPLEYASDDAAPGKLS